MINKAIVLPETDFDFFLCTVDANVQTSGPDVASIHTAIVFFADLFIYLSFCILFLRKNRENP